MFPARRLSCAASPNRRLWRVDETRGQRAHITGIMEKMQSAHPALLAQRYELLAQIGSGGMGEVWRARDRLSGGLVALKRVRISGPPTSPVGTSTDSLTRTLGRLRDVQTSGVTVALSASASASSALPESALRLLLAQEFRTLASLRHPHIISVLDYGFDAEARPFFTMELLEGAVDLKEAAAPLPPTGKLLLLQQVLAALHYLHRRGILHRDLKQRNVLVSSRSAVSGAAAGPQAKVLDFGLAIARNSTPTAGELMGTLHYMAPELLRGEFAGVGADLYAVGVMIYELFAGRPPFADAADRSDLIFAIEEEVADVGPLAAWPRLQRLVADLLAKDPGGRPASAEAVGQELLQIAGVPGLAEPASVRDSFLLAARFVGRRAELGRLSVAVDAACDGRGSSFLVGGESGVGKSRLLDELRTHALVGGMQVLRGQATQERGQGLAIFAEVVRALALSVPLVAAEVAILARLVPDLPRLLDLSADCIPKDPDVTGQAARQLLFETLAALILRAPGPLLLLLEDLHWLDPDGLSFLAQLLPYLPSCSILVIGSYRNDECRELPQKLPGAQVIALPRLSATEVAELGESMLGEAALHPELVSFLQQQTEGNAFFVVETVRALAEEAGGLYAVAAHSLPQQVLAGGIRAVVRRRLSQVPSEAMPLLQLAAVAGRELDLALLADLEPQLQSWLQTCAEAAVLEVDAEKWRFVHAKLREGLLSDLADGTRTACHARIASSLRRVYADSDEQSARIGFHFDLASAPAEAAKFLARAGQLALRRGVLNQACEQLQRAAALEEQTGAGAVQRAATLRRLARAEYGLGRNEACLAAVRRAMSVVGKPIPSTRSGRLRAILAESLTELRHRLNGVPRLTTPDERALKQEQLNILTGTGDSVYLARGSQDIALYIALCGLHAAEELGDVRHQIAYLATLGFTASLYALRPLQDHFLRRADALARTPAAGSPVIPHVAFSGLVALSQGRWADAEQAFRRLATAGNQFGERAQEALGENMLCALYCELRQWEPMQTAANRCEQLGIELGNAQYRGSARGWRAWLFFQHGDSQAAYRELGEAVPIIAAEGRASRVHRMTLCAAFALVALHCGELAVARRELDRALAGMARGRAPAVSFRIGYSAALATSVGLWRHSRGTAEEPRARTRVRQALLQLCGYAVTFPIVRPWALWGLALVLEELGLAGPAASCRMQALALRRRLGLSEPFGPA
jgi:serine/threonine protein kinase